MGRTIEMTVLVVALGVLEAVSGIYAETFTVGDEKAWTVDPAYNYTDWAKKQSVEVGDSLLFKYRKGDHDVRRVTVTQYEDCDEANYLQAWDSGEDTVVLNSTGTWYFMCSKTQHCSYGQKFSMVVSADSPPASSDGNPPSDSSSPSLLPSLAGLLALSIMLFSFGGGL